MVKDKQAGIRLHYDPTDEELEKLKLVYKRYRVMKESPDRKKMETIWDNSMKAWESHRGEKENWQSNHVPPITTAIVETALAEMEDQNSKPLILGRSSEDNPKAQVMRRIYDYTWEIANGDSESFNVKKSTLILGTAIAQEYYWQDKRIVRSVTVDKSGKEKTVEEERLGYDDCMMEEVRLQDFFVDENARSFDGPYSARDCIRRYIMHIDDFNLFFSGDTWNPLNNARYVKAGGDINYYEFYKPPMGTDMSEMVEVLWYWAIRPEDWLIITANDVMIKMGPMPNRHKELPFARSIDVKRPHSFYGKGEPELLESIQDEATTIRRMMLDRNHLDIDKMFLVSDTLNLNDEDLIARPHGMIPAGGDINGAKAIEYGDVPRSVELGYNWLNEDAINVTGIDPRTASKPQPATATEAALLKEAALKKIRMKLKIYEREFLIRIARLRVANIIQYYSQPRLEKIVGEKGTQEYQSQVDELKSQGVFQEIDGQGFQETYREIPIEGRKLDIDQNGQPIEVASAGINFFEAKPKFFMPVARGGFVIKFAAGPTLPISKPLLQTKTTEMYDRLIQLALGGIAYDAEKLGDALIKANDFDPSDFKKQEEVAGSAEQGFSDERTAQLVDLANQENEQMIQGNEIPPTPYSSPPHTQIHVEFMNSPTFQDGADQAVTQIFTTHVVGELTAQAQRGGEQGMQGGNMAQSTNGNIPSFQGQGQQMKAPQVGGNTNNPLKQMIPGKIQGGGDIPQTR